MPGRLIELGEDGRFIFVKRGFLVVKESGSDKQLGAVPLDDVAAVIGNAHGLTYSNNVLVELGRRGAPLVICGSNHNVVSVLWPLDGNFEQSRRLDAQLRAALPLKKRLWKQLVQVKLGQQAATLGAVGQPTAPLTSLVRKVRAGDPGNVEAQGARRYWRLLFGESFRRDRSSDGLNSLLNYGYTVLRACVARAIVGAGLHPSLGVHHRNAQNAFRLVDDVMEPFRPVIDMAVWQLREDGADSVTATTKRSLASTLYHDIETAAGTTPVISAVERLAVSLAYVYLGERSELEMPGLRFGKGSAGAPAPGRHRC